MSDIQQTPESYAQLHQQELAGGINKPNTWPAQQAAEKAQQQLGADQAGQRTAKDQARVNAGFPYVATTRPKRKA